MVTDSRNANRITQLDFTSELGLLLKKYRKEENNGAPVWILAEYLRDCLEAFDKATIQLDEEKTINEG